MTGIVNVKIAVLGGDRRQRYVAERLRRAGARVTVHGVEYVHNANDFTAESGDIAVYEGFAEIDYDNTDVFVLPLPLSSDGVRINAPFASTELRLNDFLEAVKPGTVVYAGRVSDSAASRASRAGVELIDYFTREELQLRNAVPTAEGAVAIMMRELPVTVRGSRCVILGYGRVGSVLCRLLMAMGASVTVYARSAADRARVCTDGALSRELSELSTVDTFINTAAYINADIVFNTIPATVIGAAELAAISPSALLVDLAAMPGGFDAAAVKKAGRRVIWALSLPGKTSPATAGEIIGDTVAGMIIESGAAR